MVKEKEEEKMERKKCEEKEKLQAQKQAETAPAAKFVAHPSREAKIQKRWSWPSQRSLFLARRENNWGVYMVAAVKEQL